MNGAKPKTRSYVSRFSLALAVLALVAFGLGLAFGAGATYAQGAPNSLSNTDWLLRGAAEYSESGSVVLTPAAGYQLGFLIHPRPVSAQRINVEFSFEIGGGSGADGLALVVARNLLDDPINGSGGSGGCGGCFASPQFVDGIAVEIDTYPNSWDISGNHLGISLLGGSSPVDLAAVNVEHELRNNGVFNAEVMFDNGRVRVYLSNPDLRMERTLLLDHTIPDFTPFQRYLGFVGTTGGATDRHIIHQVNLEGTDATPALTPAPTATPAPEPEAAPFARTPQEDFSALGINDPEGIWSDGKTMWVSSPALDRILAFNMTTKARDEGKDITNLAPDNGDPQALWSDGNTMWVGDGSYPNSDRLYGGIFAYKMDINDDGSAGPDHGVRDPGKEIVSARGAYSRGIWSDGATAWVTQHRTDVFSDIRAYLLDLDQDGGRGKQHGDEAPDKDYAGVSGEGLWSDGTTLWVAKGGDEQIHAYDLATKSRVAGKDFHSVGGFAQGIWSDGKTMWVAIGHQIHAFEMPPFSINEARPAPVTPASAATPASEPEAAPFARKPREDFDNLKLPATHGSAEGMWSDGTTIWLVETTEDRLYAFNMSTKLREGTKYFNTLAAADNTSPESNWSDGTTMWVAETDRIFAYSMSTKKRVPSEDFDTLRLAGNVGVEGIWSDGVTLWTADHDHDKLFAYNLDTKERVPDEDFNTLDDAGNNWPIAIWSNGATMWVSDWTDDKLYAYDMDSKQRVDNLDFNTLDAAGNNTPEGIWANRETMWVRDSEDGKLYAYQMPAGPGPPPAPPATPPTPAAAEISDWDALATLYLSTAVNQEWTWLDEGKKWEPDKPLTEWEGVTVNEEGRVTELRLRGKGLEGAIPPLLGSLTELQVLDLSNNQLGGVLPVELADLDKLGTLSLDDNHFSLCLASELQSRSRSSFVTLLSAPGVKPLLFCDIPLTREQISDRQTLKVFYDTMAGRGWHRSENWGTNLPLNDWQGVGTDDDGRVTHLDLVRNNLTGNVPPEVVNLTALTELQLDYNDLSGPIPPELSSHKLSMLEILSLSYNHLDGEIPAALADLPSLETLWLHGNEFTGCTPLALKRLVDTERGDLPDFCASSETETEMTERAVLAALFKLTGDPRFTDGSTTWIKSDGWNTSAPLNDWYGVTTAEIDGEERVIRLELSGNNLVGDGIFLKGLPYLEYLEVLDLSRNRLTGEIPDEMENLENLEGTGLRLYGNKFDSGCAPRELLPKFRVSYLNRPQEVSVGGVLGDLLEQISYFLPDEVTSLLAEALNQEGLPEAIGDLMEDGVITPDSKWSEVLFARQQLTGLKDVAGFGNVLDILGILTSDWFMRWVKGSTVATYGLGVPPCPPSMAKYPPTVSLEDQSLETDRTALLAIRQYYLDNDYNEYDDGHERGRNSYAFAEYPCPKFWNEDRTCLADFNWPRLGNISYWPGVTVEDVNKNDETKGVELRVTGLEITDRLLEGGIPKRVGDLGALQRLNLSRNRLSGPVPPQLGNLANLTTLALNQKSDKCGENYTDKPEGIRTGCVAERLNELPLELGNIETLSDLFLHENNFEGDLPYELGNAWQLNQVNFSDSGLTGCMPPNLQGHYGTPIIAEFLADVAHIVAWSVGTTAFPVIGTVVSTIDFLTQGFISDITGWVIKTPIKFSSVIFKEGARDSDFGAVKLYCEH